MSTTRALNAMKRASADAAKWRGHHLNKWEDNGRKQATAQCSACDAWVVVTPEPAPNETLIGGPAVAVDCPWSE